MVDKISISSYFTHRLLSLHIRNFTIDRAIVTHIPSSLPPTYYLMEFLPPDHFLSQARPDPVFGSSADVVDTSTLAAHDFDVDNRTGFMPPQAPITRLPALWEPWELVLDEAVGKRIQLGSKPGLSALEEATSEAWRSRVRTVSASRIMTKHDIVKRAPSSFRCSRPPT